MSIERLRPYRITNKGIYFTYEGKNYLDKKLIERLEIKFLKELFRNSLVRTNTIAKAKATYKASNICFPLYKGYTERNSIVYFGWLYLNNCWEFYEIFEGKPELVELDDPQLIKDNTSLCNYKQLSLMMFR